MMTYNPRIPPLVDTPEIRDIKTKPFSQQRAFFGARSQTMLKLATNRPKLVTQDYIQANWQIRHYQPSQTTERAIFFIYGGGWSLGSIEAYELFCLYLAEHTQSQVFSLDYRLAPEHKFPCAVEDTLEGYQWLVDHADDFAININQLYIMGDSAGGNLSTVVCHLRRDQGLSLPKAQILLYPACDGSKTYPSNDLFADFKYHLSHTWLESMYQSYQRTEQDRADPRFSPIKFSTHQGIPSMLLLIVDHDPLVDGILQYQADCQRDGVKVKTKHYPSMFHGFASLIGIFDESLDTIKTIQQYITGEEQSNG